MHYEYRFIEGPRDREGRSRLVEEMAVRGWRLVQILDPGRRGPVLRAMPIEFVFERPREVEIDDELLGATVAPV